MPRRAFTLIELLVVISIIAVLAAMLMPAIKLIIESARSARCVSNMRQIKMGSDLYTADWDGYLVPANYNDGVLPTVSAPTILTEYINKASTSSSEKTVWTCPSRFLTPKQWPMTYGFNTNLHYLILAPTFIFFHQSGIRRPSEVVELADAAQASGTGTSSSWLQLVGGNSAYAARATLIDANSDVNENDDSGAYTVRYRHSQQTRVNLMYIDGHTGSAPQYTLTYSNFSLAY
jgi:prepilin-type N-terminal cleavage/methylation domain-containing protein